MNSEKSVLNDAQDLLLRLGIDRLSPSHVQSWVESPSSWAMRYVHGLRTSANANMHIGSLVEECALRATFGVWKDMDPSDVAMFAMEERDPDIEMTEKEQDKLMHMVTSLVPVMRERFVGEELLVPQRTAFMQWRVERRMKTDLGSMHLPMIGYLDGLTRTGTVIEVKTSAVMPPAGKPRPDHLQQVAFYWECVRNALAMERPKFREQLLLSALSEWKPNVVMFYALARKKNPVLVIEPTVTELEDAFRMLEWKVSKLMKWLRLFWGVDDVDELRSLVTDSIPVRSDDFRMNNYSDEQVARVFGLPDQKGLEDEFEIV